MEGHARQVDARAGRLRDDLARVGGTGAELARQGGGINSTVLATRSAGEDALFREAATRVWRMIECGTTTLEIKSGYGLDLDTEIVPATLLNQAGVVGAALYAAEESGTR